MSLKEALIRLLDQKIVRKTLTILFFCHWPVGMLIAGLIPDNVMDYWWPKAYTQCVSGYFPMVSMVERCTREPSTAFMAALLVPITSLYWILMAYVVLKRGFESVVEAVVRECKTKKGLLKIILSTAMFPCCAWFIFLDEPVRTTCPTYARTDAMINSRFAMGGYGMGIISGFWFTLLIVFFAVLVVSSLIARWVNVQQGNE